MTDSRTRHMLGRTITLANGTWRVIGIGPTDEKGLSYCWLLSIKPAIPQRDGTPSAQCYQWLELSAY